MIAVLDRSSIRDGSLRALPGHLFLGQTTVLRYKAGQFAQGVILLTSIDI